MQLQRMISGENIQVTGRSPGWLSQERVDLDIAKEAITLHDVPFWNFESTALNQTMYQLIYR